MDEHLRKRIAVDPAVMAGKPVIRGTRIPVELIVRMLAQGVSEQEIRREYPRLEPEDLRAALAYAASVLSSPLRLARSRPLCASWSTNRPVQPSCRTCVRMAMMCSPWHGYSAARVARIV